MDVVIKIGGSLQPHELALRKLGAVIAELGTTHQIIVVPGGGNFAETVRQADLQYHLHPSTSHWMAIYGMTQYGHLLSDLIPHAQLVEDINHIPKILRSHQVVIFLPAHHMRTYDPLPHSWEVTSDTIAAYITKLAHFSQLILLKDVDGIYNKDPKNESMVQLIEQISVHELLKNPKSKIIDATLARFLATEALTCTVLNGFQPQRLIDFMQDQQVIGTTIVK